MYLNYNNKNLTITRGDTLQFAVEISGLDGAEVSAMKFTCKENINDSTFLFQKTLDSGITKIDDTHYKVRVRPDETKNLEIGNYYYDLEMTANDDVYTLLKGRLKVEFDITD